MVGDGYALGDAGVELDIEWQVSRVGEATSQPALVDPVEAEHPTLPVVNDAGGIGERLVVIQKDIVAADVLQFGRVEVELPRFHLRTLRNAIGEVLVCINILVCV